MNIKINNRKAYLTLECGDVVSTTPFKFGEQTYKVGDRFQTLGSSEKGLKLDAGKSNRYTYFGRINDYILLDLVAEDYETATDAPVIGHPYMAPIQIHPHMLLMQNSSTGFFDIRP